MTHDTAIHIVHAIAILILAIAVVALNISVRHLLWLLYQSIDGHEKDDTFKIDHEPPDDGGHTRYP